MITILGYAYLLLPVPARADLALLAVASSTRPFEGLPTMKCSILLDYTMRVIWGDVEEDTPKEAVAVASYVKNHKVNPENALEVVRIMWPGAKLDPYIPTGDEVRAGSFECEVWFYATFPDDSRSLIVSKRGVGDSVEVL